MPKRSPWSRRDWLEKIRTQWSCLIGLNPKLHSNTQEASETNNYTANLGVCIRSLKAPFILGLIVLNQINVLNLQQNIEPHFYYVMGRREK